MNAEPDGLVGAFDARPGQPERRMRACQRARDLNPTMDCGHDGGGRVHMSLGAPAEAIPCVKQALRRKPRFRPVIDVTYHALADRQTGQDTQAVAALNRALGPMPQDGVANLVLVAALARQGRLAEADNARDTYVAGSNRPAPTLADVRQRFGWLGPGGDGLIDGLSAAGWS